MNSEDRLPADTEQQDKLHRLLEQLVEAERQISSLTEGQAGPVIPIQVDILLLIRSAREALLELERRCGQMAIYLSEANRRLEAEQTAKKRLLEAVERERKRAEQAAGEARERTITRVELLAALSQAFAEAGLQYHQVLRTVVQRIGQTTGAACLVRLISDDRQWLELAAHYHPQPEAMAAMKEVLQPRRLRIGEGISGEVYRSGRGQILADLSSREVLPRLTPEFQEWARRFPVYSSLTVPLRAQHRTIGTLSILRTQPGRPFTQDDQEFFQELADRAALSIDNARLYVAEAQRAHELDALHRASAALLSTLDFENLLSHILDAALSAIRKADGATLHLIAPDTGQLQLRATLGYSDRRIQKVALPQLLGYPAKAVSERRSMLIEDIPETREIAGENTKVQLQVARSAIVAPLILGPKILGVLSLTSSQCGTFTQADLRLLESFATTTTTAIQNAMLHSEVQRQAVTDGLTRLYNRRGFADLAQREIERARLFHHPLALILMDIDHFKDVNDTYGHPIGDQVLRILGERLGNSVRDVDIIGRHGGEEFVILLPETDLFAACTVAERIREQVARPITVDSGLSLQITASFGVARVTNETQSLAEVLDQADKAMYVAKHRGRNRVEVG